jgi:hypothetical protein
MKKLILLFSSLAALALSGLASAQNFAANNQVTPDYEPPMTWVYPNPAIHSTTVVLNYIPVSKVFIDLVDFNGNIRRSYAFAPGGNKLSIDVGFLESGYYIMRIREGAGLIDIVKLVKG